MNTDGIIALIGDVRAGANRFLVRELEKRGIKGLSPSHGAVLFYLFNTQKATMKDLAKAVHRDKSTITALVAKLVEHGYVGKEAGILDQRNIEVRLTDKGESLRPVFLELSEKLLANAWKGIDEAEQKEVINILEKIRRNFD